MNTPVAIILFNRPEKIQALYRALREVRPPRLYLFADGPRRGHPADAPRCEAARAAALAVDWPCEVIRDFAEANLGCGRRPATAFDAVFSREPEAIFLEDDTIPHPSFFRFCEALLEKWRTDDRIAMIAGLRTDPRPPSDGSSYHFSRFTHSGAWAGWRRAWKDYDYDLRAWPEFSRQNRLAEIFPGSARSRRIWARMLRRFHGEKERSYWDYQWTFSNWCQNRLTIVPDRNLVSNIGFDADATHSADAAEPHANQPALEMPFPLRHPHFVLADGRADAYVEKTVHARPFALHRRLSFHLKKRLGLH